MLGDARKLKGYLYLSKLYSATGARVLKPVIGLHRLGIGLGLNDDEFNLILNYLEKEGLVIVYTNQDKISITDKGVRAVEQAELRPKDPTAHFPAISSAPSLGKHSETPVQRGLSRERSGTISPASYSDIKKSIQDIKGSIDKLYLSQDVRSKLMSELITIEVQLSFPKPDNAVITNCVTSIRKILTSAPLSLTLKRLLSKLTSL